MNYKIERAKMILAVGGTIGVIAILLTLFGCGPKHYQAHPNGPPVPNLENKCDMDGYRYEFPGHCVREK